MPIFDQFETEPYATYSGSYTDRYFYGSIFNFSPALSREIIALKTTDIISSFYNKDIGRSDYVEYKSGSYIASRTQNLNLRFISQNELIWNSIPTNPVDIINKNNIINPYLKSKSSWGQIFSGSYDASFNLNRTAISENALHCFFPGNGQNIPNPSATFPFINDITVPLNKITNADWLYQFPFQSRFKGIPNLIGTSQNFNTITIDIYSASLPNPITSYELGSIFYAYGDGTFKRYVQNSQIWIGLGPKTSFPSEIAHKHVTTKAYNALQKVYYSNYSGSADSAYVAFGENGTILSSKLGYSNTWEQECGTHGPGNLPFIANNPFQIPMEIDNWPPPGIVWGTPPVIPDIVYTNQIGSIRDAMPIAWNNGTKDGVHLQWLLIVEAIDTNGNRRGKLVRTKQSRWGNKIPKYDDWEYVDLDNEIGMGGSGITPIDIDLYSLCTKNPAGEDIGATIQQIWAVGKIDLYDEFGLLTGTSALIGIGGNDGTNTYTSCESSTFKRNNTGQADRADTIWFSTTGGKWNDRSAIIPYNWVCGLDCSTASPTGSGYIAISTAPNVNSATTTYSTINLTGIFGSAVDVPPLYSIAYSHQSGSATGEHTVICVGHNGTILKYDPGTISWSKKTPDNSYSGTFVDVKKVYSLNGTAGLSLYDWIIVGDDGEIQASDDDGNTWTSLRTNTVGIDYPNRLSGSSGLGDVIYKSQQYGSGSKNVVYQTTNRNNSFRSYYAGSLEKNLITSVPNVVIPAYTMAVGGVTTHDFNEDKINKPLLATYDTVITCRVCDVSGSTSINWPIYYNNFINEYIVDTLVTKSYADFIKSSDIDYYKCFFGYGDGFSLDLSEWQYGGLLNIGRKGKTPSFLDWSPYDVYGHVDVAQFRLHGPQLRGWKYGLYSGINTPTSAVWRRGRYGQFRDMLEQRIFTKYIQLEQTDPYVYPFKTLRRTVDGPVKVNFVSGSAIYLDTIDYVTATNPSYNPYDSGIYDTEYRSGQPFFDRPNED